MSVLTTPMGVLLSLQLAAPPAPPPPPAAGSEPAPASQGGSDDLAAEAPMPDWQPEGGEKAHATEKDPREVNRKLRNAARTTIAGGAIALVGVAAGVTGLVLYIVPKQQIEKTRDDSGNLPPGDAKRQTNIAAMRAAPIVGYVGAGVFLAGVITAAVAGARFKKLREERRTSVAVVPMPMWKGGGLAAEVRF